MANYFDALDIPAVDTSAVDESTDNTEDTTVDDESTDVDDSSSNDDGGDEATDESTDDDSDDSDESDDADADSADDADHADTSISLNNLTETKFKSFVKDVAKQNPQAAKLLKDLYFSNQAFAKFGKPGQVRAMKEAIDAFGSVENAVKFKQTLDMYGGEEGLKTLQNDLEQWNAVDKQLTDGSPEFVESIFNYSPEGFEKIIPTAMAKFGEANPEAYNHLMAGVIYNTFAQNGTILNISMLKQALQLGNTELAQKSLTAIESSIGNIAQLAQNAPKAKAADPAKAQLEQERQAFAKQQDEAFAAEVKASNDAMFQEGITRELNTYLKGAKISSATSQRLQDVIQGEIRSTLNANKALVSQIQALRGRRDKDGIVRLFKQHIGKLLPETTRKVAKEFNLNPGAKKAVAQSAAKNGKPVKKTADGWEAVSKFPKPEEVDRRQTTEEMILKNQMILKDGRKIKVI